MCFRFLPARDYAATARGCKRKQAAGKRPRTTASQLYTKLLLCLKEYNTSKTRPGNPPPRSACPFLSPAPRHESLITRRLGAAHCRAHRTRVRTKLSDGVVIARDSSADARSTPAPCGFDDGEQEDVVGRRRWRRWGRDDADDRGGLAHGADGEPVRRAPREGDRAGRLFGEPRGRGEREARARRSIGRSKDQRSGDTRGRGAREARARRARGFVRMRRLDRGSERAYYCTVVYTHTHTKIETLVSRIDMHAFESGGASTAAEGPSLRRRRYRLRTVRAFVRSSRVKPPPHSSSSSSRRSTAPSAHRRARTPARAAARRSTTRAPSSIRAAAGPRSTKVCRARSRSCPTPTARASRSSARRARGTSATSSRCEGGRARAPPREEGHTPCWAPPRGR